MLEVPPEHEIRERQLQLLDIAAQTLDPTNERAGFSDPAFATNKKAPVHRWVPWIAGFSSNFVQDSFRRHVQNGATVLDPFAGVGTTLVEAILCGHRAVGFEINPYAALACRTKLSAHALDANQVRDSVAELQGFFCERVHNGYVPRSLPPRGFKTRSAFYSPKVLRKVLVLQDFIATLGDAALRDLFRLAFASTMVRYSNYSYEPSLGRRVSAGKGEIEDFPVLQVLEAKLSEMADDIEWLKAELSARKPDSKVIAHSFLECQKHIAPSFVDLVVTSPPYLNNYHYNRNTRPQLYWLDLARQPNDLHALEVANFGKFWQTVREAPRVDLTFSLLGSDLAERLEALRSLNPDMGVYGGNGWANYAASYFNDCFRFAQGLRYALKPGATALVVIGNSILHGIEIATDRYLGAIAESVGLQQVEIHVPRATRVGNSIIMSGVRVAKAPESRNLYEAVVELRN